MTRNERDETAYERHLSWAWDTVLPFRNVAIQPVDTVRVDELARKAKPVFDRLAELESENAVLTAKVTDHERRQSAIMAIIGGAEIIVGPSIGDIVDHA